MAGKNHECSKPALAKEKCGKRKSFSSGQDFAPGAILNLGNDQAIRYSSLSVGLFQRLSMTRQKQYIAGGLFLAPLCFIASFLLCMKLVAVEDPGLPIGEIDRHVDGHEIISFDPNYNGTHQGEFPPEPLWPKIAFGVACPILHLIPENGFPDLSDHANGELVFVVMAINSILWGLLLVFLFRLVTRLFIVKHREIAQAL